MIDKLTKNPREKQHICQNEERNIICEKSSPQDCSHETNGNNDGNMKLKNMDPTSQNHEYQKLMKRLWSKRRPFPEVDQMAVKSETKLFKQVTANQV